jgi:hypothetical protein
MHNPIFEPKRNEDGSIDIRSYAREAQAERRAVRNAAMRALARGTKRTICAVIALAAFWNIPALGSSGTSKEMLYR